MEEGCSAKKKSCRRSSFTPGRSLFTHISKVALSQDIDATLPAELRLADLTKKCVTYTLDVLAKEISSFNKDIQDEVETQMITEINSLTNENTFYDLCHKQRYTENPENVEINKTVAQFESVIKKLNNESKLWEDLKIKTKKMVEESEVKDVKKMIMYDGFPHQILNNAESYMPTTQTDHNSIRKTCLESLLRANTSINSLEITHRLLSNAAMEVHSQLTDLQSNFIKYPTENTLTPRGLLTRMPIVKLDDTGPDNTFQS